MPRPSARPADRGATPRFRQRLAAAVLRSGGLVGHPTEAVYGLGCDPHNPCAVAQLLALKHRPWRKGLLVIAHAVTPLHQWVEDAALDDPALTDHGSGPTTWLVPAGPKAPAWITGGGDEIAVRIITHPTAAALCAAFGEPIVSTSANPGGRRPARTAIALRRYFGNQVDYILGDTVGGWRRPSTIRRWPGGEVVRDGG